MSSDFGSARNGSPGKLDRPAFVSALKACGALQFGTFTLASGKTSSYYVDIKRAITRPDLLRTIAEAMAPFVRGRSEERRVGKEGKSRRGLYQSKDSSEG